MRKALIAAVAVSATAVLCGGVAYASIPDSGGVIHACYLPGVGVLRVIDTDTGQSCSKSETALTWNQQGQPGPQGPAGAQGPAGPQGPAGVSGYQVESCMPGSGVQQTQLSGTYTFPGPDGQPNSYSYNPLCSDTSSTTSADAVLSCPSGKVAISAGYVEGNASAHLQQMSPTPDGTGYKFYGAGDAGNVLVFVTCAAAS